MTANLSYPTVPTARQIGLPWGGRDASLYPASIDHRHPGLDLLGPSKCNVYAVASGSVVWAGYEQAHGYGRHIAIQHRVDREDFLSGYAHLREIRVAVGDEVTAGEVIGSQGGDLWDRFRGASRGPHLHFEIILPDEPDEIDFIRTYRGYSVNPLVWLANTYLPTPRITGAVVEAAGVRLRLSPSTNKQATIVGALAFRDVRGFAEEYRDDAGNVWLRLNTLRTVWAAARYNKRTLIDYKDTPASPPVSIETPDVDEKVRLARLDELNHLAAIINERKAALDA